MRPPKQPVLIPLPELNNPAQLGGKGAGLAALTRAGLPVPPTWVLPAAVLRDHLARLGLAALAEQVERTLVDGGWELAARQLRSAILHAPLPDEIANAAGELLDALRARDPAASLAIRSSATCEGLPGASFAGQFQTFLDVRDIEQASAAIRSCWASLWSGSALRYRAAQAVWSPPEMALLFQVYAPAVAAGAARVSRDGVLVESALGLGPSVMSGLVAPDRYSFTAEGRFLGACPGRKPIRAGAEEGNLIWHAVASEHQGALSLEEHVARRVAELALSAAAVCGTPLEVEWALAEDVIWMLQARPSQPASRVNVEHCGSPSGSELRGIPVAPGEVIGRVRFVEGASERDEAGPGDIIVTRYAAAALLATFGGAGLITEMGGASAHVASLARERRVPMVAGALRATQRLREGQLVRLDGTRGVVELLETS